MPETMREKAAVQLSDTEYAKTFSTFIDRCTGYDTMMNLTSKVIQQNKFDVNPIKMLSIGAGRGHFEVRLVQEFNLKLDFIYAVEPTKAHVAALQTSLQSIGTKYHINPTFFNEQFIMESNETNGDTLFDFILMSHSLYGFKDPCTVVAHAASFLKPSGVMLLFNQSAASVAADIYNYVVQQSNPELLGKTFQDNSLVPTDIVNGLRKTHPTLGVEFVEEMAHLEVDDFVRRVDDENRDDVVSFLLGTAYRDLSPETQEHVYGKVAGSCDIIDGKYWMRHPEAAIQVYHNQSAKSHEFITKLPCTMEHHDTESAFDTTNDFASSYADVWAYFKSHYESPTFLQSVGAIHGMSVLDLACGPGHYTRTLKELGADTVVGVDVSESMLRQARAIEEKSNLGILYLQGDAADFKYQNAEQPYFDVVTAAYLFPYAESTSVLRSFCETIYSNLKPGGRFVTLSNADLNEKNMNEDFVTPYGLDIKIQDVCNEYAAELTNNDGKRLKVTLYSPDRKKRCIFYDYAWSFQTIKKIMEEVGFEEIRKVNVAETMIFVLSATKL